MSIDGENGLDRNGAPSNPAGKCFFEFPDTTTNGVPLDFSASATGSEFSSPR